MRHRAVVVALYLWSALIGSAPLPAAERPLSSVESKIWELENAYVARLQSEDVIGLAEFWHDEFTGWPSHAPEPVDRSSSRASISTLLETIRILSFEIEPLMIRRVGGIAVVHYRLRLSVENNDGIRSTTEYRITHTWLEEAGRWRIVGGMSSAIGARSTQR